MKQMKQKNASKPLVTAGAAAAILIGGANVAEAAHGPAPKDAQLQEFDPFKPSLGTHRLRKAPSSPARPAALPASLVVPLEEAEPRSPFQVTTARTAGGVSLL